MEKPRAKRRMQGFTAPVKRDVSVEVIRRFFEALDSPVSLSCWLLYRYGEHRQLAEKTLNPLHYNQWVDFMPDYLAVKYLSKYIGLETGIDTRDAALSEWERCERKCQVLNDQLTDLWLEDPVVSLNSENDWRFSRIVAWLRGKISSILGPLDVNEVFDKCRFGPGSTTRVGGTKTSAYEKFTGTPHSTQGALPYCAYLSEQWENFPHRFELVRGNKVTFVLKNAKTQRPIAMEPDMNQFMQLGFGTVIQLRLADFNVDIRDQLRNQRFAYLGSLNGESCTIDLKSASELWCRVAVELLLPDDWYSALDAVRSHEYAIDGRQGTYHKFSSMGNGFTFPLQTLLFYALACLASRMTNVGYTQVSVYGDDIIVHRDAYEVLCRLLNLFGLEVNSSKSFNSGYFRESCGKDYFQGVDCQPLYLKDPIQDGSELVKFANSLRRLSMRCSSYYACDARFESLWRYCVGVLPRDIRRTRIPDGYGDGGLVSSFEEAMPQRAPGGIEGFLYDHWVFLPEGYEMEDSSGALRVALFSVDGREIPQTQIVVRHADGVVRQTKVLQYYAATFHEHVQDTMPKYGIALHRKRGRWVRRRGVARFWPSLGGWI